MSDTAYTVTLDFPLTIFVPDDLIVISTISPEDNPQVRADFPSSYQYTLTFTDLNPGVDYSYTVQVVLQNNKTAIVTSASGTFSTVILREFHHKIHV